MKHHTLVLGVTCVLLGGCQAHTPGVAEQAASVHREPLAQSLDPDQDLGDALELWRAGEVDTAVQMYITVASRSPAREQDLLVFDLTEAEYAALSEGEQSALLQQWLDQSRDLRRLTRAVLESESQIATHAVEQVGRVHAESDRALIAQKTGEAILRRLKANDGSR